MATASSELTAEAALVEIGRIERIQGALEDRTAGITWLVWGLVGAAIFVTYSFVGLLVATQAPGASWSFAFLWAPWTAVGAFVTAQLWRAAGLVLRVEPGEGRKEGILAMIAFLVLIFGSLWLADAVHAPIVEPAVVLFALGAATTLVAALGLHGGGPMHRRLGVLAGTTLAIVAVVGTLAVAGEGSRAAYTWFSLIAPLAVLSTHGSVGAYLVLRR